MSFELRPPLPHDKGLVVAELAEGLTHVCFLGDDLGDLEAFDALDQLSRSRAPPRSGWRWPAPNPFPSCFERADLVVDGPEGALDLLRELADRVEAS